MTSSHQSAAPRPRNVGDSRRGFALIITITLLAFLVLLLVSLSSLTRVETRVASNTQGIAVARQNALMALNLALGQLQKTSGLDQRVTAPADMLIPSDVSVGATTTGNDARTALDTFWQASRNRHWTGVWKNGNTATYTAATATAPKTFNATPVLLGWLVSGNENTAAYAPADRVNPLAVSSSPLDSITDSTGRPHRLLVRAGTSLDRAVTAPEITVNSTSVPGLDGSPTPVGHYAWWVGDEGVKARANLRDPYASDTSEQGRKRRRAVAQRPAVEAMTTTGADGLASGYPANGATLETVLDARQLDLLNNDTTYRAALSERFHDLTTRSRGVLADVKHGGLRRDLSYILGQPDVADFRAALNAAFDSGPPAPQATYNAGLSSAATPYATFPVSSSLPLPWDQIYPLRAATWEQLWSFHNLGNLTSAIPAGVFNASGQAVPRRQTATDHGVYPLLVQAKLFYRLRIVGGAPDPDGVNRSGDIWVDIIPLAVIANPYSVPLAPADYTLRFSGNQPYVRFGATTPAGGTPTEANFATRLDNVTQSNSENARNLTAAYTGQIRLVLRSEGLAPGEARVFTIDPSLNGGNLVQITSNTDTKQVILTNEFDPVPALTYNFSANTMATTKRIPADKTHVALYSGGSQMNVSLYMDYDAAEGHRRATQFSRGQGSETENNYFLVAPLSNGIQQGGGLMFAINEAQRGVAKAQQQALFYQLNYRSQVQTFAGSDSVSHILEWSYVTPKQGNSGGPGTTPNPFIEANLLHPDTDAKTVRWGLVQTGEGPNQTVTPAIINASGDVGYRNILYDLPSPGVPVSCLGQLQHFNTTGHIQDTDAGNSTVRTLAVPHTFQVNYPIANSYVHPRVPRDQVFNYTQGMGYHYDGSYLWNDVLWDRFYFSTYPVSGGFNFTTDRLVNGRLRPFRDSLAAPLNDPAPFRGDGNPSNAANSRRASENLLLEGAFNINSTSVEAWKALLSSLRGAPSPGETAAANLNAPFARTLNQIGGAANARAGNTADAWNGTHNFSLAEIDTLAREIVLQVRRRGPFLSLADFVNRRLVTTGEANDDLALSGALQAAIDRSRINRKNDVAAPFNEQTQANLAKSQLVESAYRMNNALAGFPGYVLQGDLLSALGSSLSARSDTFVIRAYGDGVNPATGEVEGRAWCEAVVQRLPDYVVPKNGNAGNAPTENATDPANLAFGRRYQVVDFRWLNPDEL